MERKEIPKGAKELSPLFNHIFQNAFGTPVIFDSAPALSEMKGNSWGKNGTTLYIKFADGTGISISGVQLT